MSPDASEVPQKPRWRRIGFGLIKLWFAFHVIAITLWSLPLAPTGVRNGQIPPYGTDWLLVYNERYILNSPARHYLTWSGFWQYWDMFSPDPSDTDVWGAADIVYRDGTMKRFQYPRMYLLSIPKKYVMERYRKFYERVYPDAFRYMWPVFAQRIALENYRDPNNPPVKVVLRRHWYPIPKVGQPLTYKYLSFAFYQYEVDQQALEQARRGG